MRHLIVGFALGLTLAASAAVAQTGGSGGGTSSGSPSGSGTNSGTGSRALSPGTTLPAPQQGTPSVNPSLQQPPNAGPALPDTRPMTNPPGAPTPGRP